MIPVIFGQLTTWNGNGCAYFMFSMNVLYSGFANLGSFIADILAGKVWVRMAQLSGSARNARNFKVAA